MKNNELSKLIFDCCDGFLKSLESLESSENFSVDWSAINFYAVNVGVSYDYYGNHIDFVQVLVDGVLKDDNMFKMELSKIIREFMEENDKIYKDYYVDIRTKW